MKNPEFLRTLFFSLIIALLSAPGSKAGDMISISTYFPSPEGSYRDMEIKEVITVPVFDDILAEEGDEGDLAYNKSDNFIYYYASSGWQKIDSTEKVTETILEKIEKYYPDPAVSQNKNIHMAVKGETCDQCCARYGLNCHAQAGAYKWVCGTGVQLRDDTKYTVCFAEENNLPVPCSAASNSVFYDSGTGTTWYHDCRCK